jgi:hypothetical protein
MLQEEGKLPPIKNKVVTTKPFKSPWITPELRECIRKKYRIFKKYKLGMLPFQTFKSYRNLLVKSLKLAKKLYFCNKIEACSSDSRKVWQVINNILKPKCNNSDFCIKIENRLESNSNIIAQSFNNYFVEIPHLLQSEESITDEYLDLITMNDNNFFFFPITPDEVKRIICALKENSLVYSDTPTKIVKAAANILSVTLSDLFNYCLENVYFPDELKLASVIPLFKKGSRNLINSYRPISLLSPITKIFEKLIYDRVADYFSRKKLFCKEQFGFIKGRSIQAAVLNLLHDLNMAINNNKYSIVVFLDYSKAFDTVSHDLLLKKLYRYGFRGCVSDFLKSYFSSRKQSVKIKNSFSDVLDVNIGVPQGSSLGPLYFLIFVNEFTKICRYCKSILYADDSVIYLSGDTLSELQDRVNHDISLIYKWSKANGLTLNIDKTKCMLVTTRSRERIEIKLNNNVVEEVESFEYLGIIIQNNLKFNLYIEALTSTVSKAAGILYSLGNYLPDKSLKLLFYSLVYPKLSLHILAWGKCPKTVLHPLRVALNRVVRCLSSSRYEHTRDLYHRLDILTIEKLFKFKMCQFMYKEHNEQSCMFFNVREDFGWRNDHDTRHDRPYRFPFNRLQLTSTYFLNHALALWPLIPIEIKNLKLVSFKAKVRKLIMSDDL